MDKNYFDMTLFLKRIAVVYMFIEPYSYN